eukprot:scaffold2437_cov395-Prasinococcus_capsulatus_cf.AAC.18
MGLPFEALAELDMLFYSISTILKFAALVRLRSTMADFPRPFKIPLGDIGLKMMVVPPILICVFVVANCSTNTLLIAAAISVLGSLAYTIFVRPGEQRSQSLFAET